MINIKDIKDWDNIVEFYNEHDEQYKKDNKARAILNKTLETNYKAVFRMVSVCKQQWKTDRVDWSGESFYVLTEKGKLLKFTNSEWAFFNKFV